MTDRRILEPWQKMLLDAADCIEKHGWVQGQIGHPQVGFCLSGAIIEVSHDRDMQKAADAVKAHLRCPPSDHFGPVVKWNDAPGRTKEEVVAALRASVFADTAAIKSD